MCLNQAQYFIVSSHREENVDSPEISSVDSQYLMIWPIVKVCRLYFRPIPELRKRLDDLGASVHDK